MDEIAASRLWVIKYQQQQKQEQEEEEE